MHVESAPKHMDSFLCLRVEDGGLDGGEVLRAAATLDRS